MKQYTFYPNQGQQILARILLTIWLPVVCSPDITLATSEPNSPGAQTEPSWCLSVFPEGSSGLPAIDQEGWVDVGRISDKDNSNPGDEQEQSRSPQEVMNSLRSSDVPQGDHQQALNVAADKVIPTASTSSSFVDLTPGSSGRQGDHQQAPNVAADKVIPTASTSSPFVAPTPGSSGRQGKHQQAPNVAAENNLRIAAAQGKVAQVKRILTTQDININAVDDQGKSALHQAVMAGHKETAVLLIRHGADVTLKDHQENKTPLDYANNKDRQYLSTIAVLAQLFSTLNNLIEDGIIKNQGDIDQKLNEVWMGLGKLEQAGPKGEEQCRYFKYRYYVQRAKYLRALGDEEEAYHQEELAEPYQDLPSQSLDADEQQELEAQIASGTEGVRVTAAAIAHMQNLLRGISAQGILDAGIYTQLANFVATAQELPSNFSSYCNISRAREDSIMQIAGLIDNISQIPDNSDLKQKSQQVQSLLEALETAVLHAIDLNRIAFIKSTIALPGETKNIFFSNFGLNEDTESRYQTLKYQFNPAKAQWIPAAYHQDAKDLLTLITFCRDQSLANSISAARYKKVGDITWRKFKDYEYGQQGQWDKLTILKREDLEPLTPKQLNASRIESAKEAYKYYRAGSREVAQDDTKSQMQFRASMALCLAAIGKPLAAYLYALAAFNLTEDDSKDQEKAKKILGQVKAGTPAHHGRGAATTETLDEAEKALAYLEMLAGKIMFKSDKHLVSCEVSEEEILQASKQANDYGGAACTAGWTGLIGSAASILSVCALEETIIATGMMFGPFAILAWVPFWVGGAYMIHLDGRRAKLEEEIEVRKALHSMIADAIKYYEQGKRQKFLEKLSSEYHNNERLLSLKEIGTLTARDKIIGLLASGIRPDGIACLFNNIGAALNSNSNSDPVSVPGCRSDELPYLARHSFEYTLHEKLAEAAKTLDKSVSEIRRQIREEAPRVHQLSDFSQPQKCLPPEHRTAAQKMPFKARLDSARNAAKLNIALIEIQLDLEKTSMKKKGIEQVKRLAREVQDSIRQYSQFDTVIANQLAAIKEIVWILSGQSVDNGQKTTKKATPDLRSSEEATDLGKLQERLKQTKLPEERVQIYIKIAEEYIKKAQEQEKDPKGCPKEHWQSAENNYVKALQLRKYDRDASLDYAKCLIKLSKYDRAVRYLKRHPRIENDADFWVQTSIAYRNQREYTKAEECISEALQLDPQSLEALDAKRKIEEEKHKMAKKS